ncbi:tyrosine-type recombinase/integrase [Amycolatopsis sp. NPDC005232]|uniref:tyrosine-type recombinase/integrase n=1 Tax=Amycolatopsis sp. NPDC005232 TaxID=3157027 RepID=UPI0033B7A934
MRTSRASPCFDDVEDIIEISPFYKMEVPAVPENPPAILRDHELTALLATTVGKSFVQLRDRAIMLVLIDCGVRLGELCALRAANPAERDPGSSDFEVCSMGVLGKGRRARPVPFNPATGEALRRRHRHRRPHRPHHQLLAVHPLRPCRHCPQYGDGLGVRLAALLHLTPIAPQGPLVTATITGAA